MLTTEMIYAGQQMKSDQTLLSYGIKDGSIIYIFKHKSDSNVKTAVKGELNFIIISIETFFSQCQIIFIAVLLSTH